MYKIDQYICYTRDWHRPELIVCGSKKDEQWKHMCVSQSLCVYECLLIFRWVSFFLNRMKVCSALRFYVSSVFLCTLHFYMITIYWWSVIMIFHYTKIKPKYCKTNAQFEMKNAWKCSFNLKFFFFLKIFRLYYKSIELLSELSRGWKWNIGDNDLLWFLYPGRNSIFKERPIMSDYHQTSNWFKVEIA